MIKSKQIQSLIRASSICDRVILLIMDSSGCGAAIDAHEYGDQGSNTLQNISLAVPGFSLPFFSKLGLGNITPIQGVPKNPTPIGAYGRMQEKSIGKDTTTGHFEICGLVTDTPFPTFPTGFPIELIRAFCKKTGKEILGNRPASGTAILDELGEEHIKTGKLIVYTSADSVFQIAAHEDIVPIEELYQIGEIARKLCDSYRISRVIVRPFIGKPGAFKRTYNRKDFSMIPPHPTVLEQIKQAQIPVIGIGKIADIFAEQGISQSIHTEGNADGFSKVLYCLKNLENGLIFCNLVDFDMLYGHRRDPKGYAQALVEMDAFLPILFENLGPKDMVIITADHGNDPTFPGSDHTREDVPLLAFSKHTPIYTNLGTRSGFYDVAQTLCDAFGTDPWIRGDSFLDCLF